MPKACSFAAELVIAPNWVLTAAHCFDDLRHKGQKTVFAKGGFEISTKGGVIDVSGWRLEVLGGTDNLAQLETSAVRQVERVIVHPDYDRATMLDTGNDIALVRLASSLREPYAVLSLDPGNRVSAGEIAQVAGFGLLNEGALLGAFTRSDKSRVYAGSNRLQQVRLPVVDCEAKNNLANGKGRICAGLEKGGKDSCQADSGGPLVLLSPKRYPYQVGLVSWGDGCARANAYGVYTRLSHHARFIRRHVPGVQTVGHLQKNKAQEISEKLAFADQALRQLAQTLGSAAQKRVQIELLDDAKQPFSGIRVRLGEEFIFRVRSDLSGRLVLLDINANGRITPIFPNRYVKASSVGMIKQGSAINIPDRGYGFDAFRASEPLGKSRLLALVLPPSFDVSQIIMPPKVKAKGFEPVRHEKSYLMNVLHQIIRIFSLRSGATDSKDWGMTVLEYEVIQ